MKRRYSLKGFSNFREAMQKGIRLYSPSVKIVVYKKNGHNQEKEALCFAIVVSRKFGTAVERNTIKRRIRNIISEKLPFMRLGYYIIIFPDESSKEKRYHDLKEEIVQLLQRSRVLKQ